MTGQSNFSPASTADAHAWQINMAARFIYRGFRVAKRLRFLLFTDEKIKKVSFSRKAVYLLLAGTAWGCSYYGWLQFLHKSEVDRLLPVVYARVEVSEASPVTVTSACTDLSSHANTSYHCSLLF